MPVQTKICGLSTPETLGAAIAHGAAYVGFVFFPKSPRNLDFDRAAALAALIPGHIRKVGVLVNPDDAFVDRAVAAAGLDILQLHGAEPPERAAVLARRHGIGIWKAIPVKARADLAAAARYRDAADHILYDAKTPDEADLPGGMGLRFDWHLLEGFRHPLPWALSGGLDARNLAEAVGVTGADLVDTSSGVETSPGVKDVDKIAAFLQSASQL
ncbi:phosphoribosylanthranilate isomerase [Sphingomonas fennica]|uniref:N-(5'-phosphoribosyl)anthranilate isomerase n=1 Tax=Edaphosphingomonas fennica TaxID=114404 RepID=A0A2T4HU32_9SPHN|nr:phosphoribosylanthranilate isomerase [Sphingomonas fennica]PTD19305.1 phosphoribosylanthranilate isomerase [Sphingomonas fennica]